MPNEDDLDDDKTALWYILVRCIEEFRQKHGFYAGSNDHNEDSSLENKLKTETEFKEIKAMADAHI